jgi:hypothetical protein
VSAALKATLERDQAALRFPYDERLRRLVRAIPGRVWDLDERVWRVPLEPHQADALRRLLAAAAADVSDELARRLERRARRMDSAHVDLARPDERQCLTFARDAPAGLQELLRHDGALIVPTLNRVLVPLDNTSLAALRALRERGDSFVAAPAVEAALASDAAMPVGEGPAAGRAEAGQASLRRDRRGERWVHLPAVGCAQVERLAAERALTARRTADGAVAVLAVRSRAAAIAELLELLPEIEATRELEAWVEHASRWRGTVDVGGAPGRPQFLLIGDREGLPRAVRERTTVDDGVSALPLSAASWELIGAHLAAWVTPAARRCAAAVEAGRPAPGAVLALSRVHERPTFVLEPGHDAGARERFLAIAGAAEGETKVGDEHRALAALSADPFCVEQLDGLLAQGGIWVDPPALAQLQRIREEHAEASGLIALSSARDGNLSVAALAGELKPFQRAGVEYALLRRRTFIADEQGLGKTVQALAAIEAAGAYPAIVACPATLKLGWEREARRWLPAREVRVLSGGRGGETGEITIVNYDVLAARAEQLTGLAPQALVLDEAHYCKSPGAARTRAAHTVAAAVAPDGLVLALTGTPVVNRPEELISQLRLLGRLGEFGSGKSFAERFRGPDAHRRLHWHLRSRCMVRRVKSEVLPQLAPKTRAVIPVELDNAAEYRLAEQDLIAWLRTLPLDLSELDAKLAAAARAERLVRLNALKLLAARGKLHAALAWIHDFLAGGEPLVVFAHHREIQTAVLERFPAAAHVLGTDSGPARQRAVEEFQAHGGPQLIVCSTQAASHGLTLTRASNVAFLELDWTSTRHDQAEDRCHRIGQRDAVCAHYVLAAETVDETIAELLERKRAVVAAVTDGRESDGDDVVGALAAALRGTPYRHLRAVA